VLSNGPLYDVRVIVAICRQQRRYETTHVRPPIYIYPSVSEVLAHVGNSVGNAVTVSLDS